MTSQEICRLFDHNSQYAWLSDKLQGLFYKFHQIENIELIQSKELRGFYITV